MWENENEMFPDFGLISGCSQSLLSNKKSDLFEISAFKHPLIDVLFFLSVFKESVILIFIDKLFVAGFFPPYFHTFSCHKFLAC